MYVVYNRYVLFFVENISLARFTSFFLKDIYIYIYISIYILIYIYYVICILCIIDMSYFLLKIFH